jgi:hypothetical protein
VPFGCSPGLPRGYSPANYPAISSAIFSGIILGIIPSNYSSISLINFPTI